MTIRVGIVGYGSIGALNHRAIDQVDGAEVVAVASPRPPNIQGVRWTPTVEELLDDAAIDVVAVCTPSGLHATQALAALRRDKHVVVEKPLTLDLQQGINVVDEARRRRLTLSVISQRRFETHPALLRGYIDAGSLEAPILGEARILWHRDADYYRTSSWRGTPEMDGGVLMNQAIHAIDLLHWVMGPIREVSSVTDTLRHEIRAEDTAAAWLRFMSGALGVLVASTALSEGQPAELAWYFRSGKVVLHDSELEHWTVPLPSAVDDSPARGSGAHDPAAITIAGHVRQWADVVDAIARGRDPLVTGEDGLATGAVVLALLESAERGQPISPGYRRAG